MFQIVTNTILLHPRFTRFQKANPNRITKLEQIAQPLVVRFFCGTAERRKLAFVSDDGAQKTASASAECRFASVSMMARGGREKASQRLNPDKLQGKITHE